MQHTQEQLEFLISQYVDGTLSELERRIVEDRLKTDPDARALVEEYRGLNRALVEHITIPDIDLDQFQQDLRDSIADEPLPLRPSYPMFNKGYLRIAAAAVLVLAASGGIFYWNQRQPDPGAMLITGPKVDPGDTAATTAKSSLDVHIGPAPSMSPEDRARNALSDPAKPGAPRIEISGAEKPEPAPNSDDKLH